MTRKSARCVNAPHPLYFFVSPSADHSPTFTPEHFELIAPVPRTHARECSRRPRLGLSVLDRLAAGALVADEEPATLLELIRSSAESLSHQDSRERDDARVRLLSREIAVQKASLDLMTKMIGERIEANDDRGALLMDKLANGFARRLQILCGEHRACSLAERQPNVVAIGHADHVRIGAE